MKNFQKMGKIQSGFSILELLAVLALAGLIIAGVLIGLGTARDNNSIREQSEAISTIYTNISNLFSEDATTNLNNSLAISTGMIPKSLKVSGTNIFTQNDGAVTLTPTGTSGFVLTWAKVKTGKVCVEMAKYQRKVGWDTIKVGSTVVYDSTQNLGFISLVNTACNSSTAGTLTLTFTQTGV